MSEAVWLYVLGLSLLIVSVLIITHSFTLAFGLAFGILALYFLREFEDHRKGSVS